MIQRINMKLSLLLISSFLVPTLFTSGCRKDPVAKDGYIVFGHFYGFCEGEQCIELYKYENGVLYEDQRDQYPPSALPYNGRWVKLRDGLKGYADDIQSNKPDSMMMFTDSIFGMPDAVDQGGVYFELKEGDSFHYWVMDNSPSALPEYLRPFAALIRERSRSLSE